MAETPSVLPAGAKPTSPATPAGEQSARVVDLPDKLLSVARAQRVEGEVVRQNNDGSTRIRTDAGNIDVQLRGKQPDPGTRVQVDIPAGNPPRQVTVRPAPEQVQQQPAPQPQTPAPPPTQTTTPQPAPQQPAPTRPMPAPAVPLPPATSTPAPPPPVTQPLPEQAAVRLMPVPPAQVQAVIQQTLAAMPAPLPASVTTAAFTTNLIAQAAPDNLVTQLLSNVLKPVAPLLQNAPGQAPALTTAPPPASAPAGAAFLSQAVPVATQAPVLPMPTLTLAPATGAPLQTTAPMPSAGVHVPFQPMSAFLTPALATDTPLAPKAAMMLDVIVTKITLPTAQLLSSMAPPLSSSPSVQPVGTQPVVQIGSAQPIAGQIQAPVTPVPIQAFTPPATATPMTLTATVIGTTPQGMPLVSLPVAGGMPQTFVLQFPASNLPVGAQIQFTPQAGQAMPVPAAPVAAPLAPLTHALPSLLTGTSWPVLDELLQTLQQAEPSLAQAMTRALPSPASPRSLPPAALLFLAAAKAGDLNAWLGDKKVEILQKLGRSSLLGRLSGDGQQIARTSAEPLSNTDWRAVPLPMFWDNEIQKVTLYFKRGDEGDGRGQDGGEQTRFIFDLSLTRMGEMQIDGLMRGQRLDLIVRSQSPFSQSMQAHMRQLYTSAIEDVALSGDLSFQGDPRQWVQVLKADGRYGANA